MKSKKNPTFPWLEDLLSYFLKVKELDDEIEQIRVSLCDISQFSPLSLFEHLDIDSKSFLTLNDFISFLRSQNATYDELKLRKMIHNFDKDNDFSLNLDEFLGLILPRKNSVLQKNMLSMVNSYNQNNSSYNNITQDMKSNFNDLILREMKLIKDLDEISSKIKNSKIFSTYEAFLEIVGDDKYMTKFNLYNFLKKNEAYINDSEVAQLMFRLDADNDDRISYEEFKEIFYPIKEDFVYLPKNDNYNKYSYNENKYNKYEINKKYDYSNNYENENDNDYMDKNNNKDYEQNEYENSNNNYNNNDNDNNYVPKKYDDTNNYNNNSNDYKNDINDYDEKEKENENENDNSKNENPDENQENKGKKGKKTKKVILRPGLSRNNNSNSNENLLHSQDPKKNDLMNNPQETSYSKFPNINNNNSTDNYTINNNKISKYNNYTFSKTNKSKEPSYNEDNYNNNNAYNNNSKITQESLVINKYNKYTSNKYNIEEDKLPDNNTSEVNNYESTLRSRRFFSPKNNYDYNENSHDNHNNTTKCKACLYSAKNIYNNYREKKSSNSPSSNINDNDNDNFNDIDDEIKNNNNIFKNGRKSNIDEYNYSNDICKTKEELLRKYGDLDNNNRNNYFFSSEKNYSSSINRHYSSPRENNLDINENNYDNNNLDNYNFDNEEKETPQINTTKRITENRYISNNISNNNYSPPPIISKNNENENDKNKKNKNTFKERFQRIMENKENTDNLENLENIENNTNNNNNDTPSFSKYRQFNKINININTDIKGNNNMQEKKNLLFKLLLEYIEQDNKLQKIKESLASRQDASLGNIFELFNINKNNIICSSDIYDVLNSLSQNNSFSPNDIKYIFKKYNKSIECGFNYDDFCEIILPRKYSAKVMIQNRNNINNELGNETNNIILELFEAIIEGEKNCEEIRSMISMMADNIFYDIFGEIKKENKPGIQKDDIGKFMKENGYDIKDYEIGIIMEKMDKNKDSIIDYEEFISEIQPKII